MVTSFLAAATCLFHFFVFFPFLPLDAIKMNISSIIYNFTSDIITVMLLRIIGTH